MYETEVEQLQRMIDESSRIVFFGGAGVSTESGIPDFRSADGIYRQQYCYSPEEVNIYAVDFSSQMLCPFEDDAHVGGVVIEGEDDRLNKLFGMLMKILQNVYALIRFFRIVLFGIMKTMY